jgi:hypothetical protein
LGGSGGRGDGGFAGSSTGSSSSGPLRCPAQGRYTPRCFGGPRFFKDLGAAASEDLPELPLVDTTPQALHGSDEDRGAATWTLPRSETRGPERALHRRLGLPRATNTVGLPYRRTRE